jgi:hypothetical protein
MNPNVSHDNKARTVLLVDARILYTPPHERACEAGTTARVNGWYMHPPSTTTQCGRRGTIHLAVRRCTTDHPHKCARVKGGIMILESLWALGRRGLRIRHISRRPAEQAKPRMGITVPRGKECTLWHLWHRTRRTRRYIRRDIYIIPVPRTTPRITTTRQCCAAPPARSCAPPRVASMSDVGTNAGTLSAFQHCHRTPEDAWRIPDSAVTAAHITRSRSGSLRKGQQPSHPSVSSS